VAESAHHYVYDDAGNIGSKQVEKPGLAATMTTYGHNSLNQLTAIGGSGGTKTVIVRGETTEPASVKVKPGTSTTWKNARMLACQRFEADIDLATGPNQINVQAKDGSNNTSNYTYALNLAAAPAATPTHDLDGNLLSDGVRSYEWDIQNRLIKITWGAGSNKTTEFRYNALGQRSQRIEKTGTTTTAHHYYLYDGIRLLSRYTGGTASTNLDRRYYNEGEQRKNSAAWDGYHYTRDHLGSIREVLAANGTLVARYDYDPYGKRTAQYEASGYTCDLGYTSHITQPSPVPGQTEVVMTVFRGYDPELGRWLSADPIAEAGGHNLYVYVRNRPVNTIDSLGLLDLGMIGEAFSGSAGVGLEAGIKKCKLGPVDVRGPSIGAAWKAKGDLGGGIGSSIDVSANLLAIAFREYKAGLGFANESGFYTPYGGKAQVIDNTQKVCGLKRDGAKWSSKSPWTIGLEVSAIVNVGFSVDFKQIWDGLWH
jgi:RHS repeat-associated protein